MNDEQIGLAVGRGTAGCEGFPPPVIAQTNQYRPKPHSQVVVIWQDPRRGSGRRLAFELMALVHEESGDASFDEWVADEGGEEAVVAMIEDTKRRAAEGSLRGFHDEASYAQFLKDLGPGRRKPA